MSLVSCHSKGIFFRSLGVSEATYVVAEALYFFVVWVFPKPLTWLQSTLFFRSLGVSEAAYVVAEHSFFLKISLLFSLHYSIIFSCYLCTFQERVIIFRKTILVKLITYMVNHIANNKLF